VELLTKITEEDMLKTLELAGRVCYKSEDKITTTSAKKFVQSIMKNNHQSVLEHINLSFRLITDRGASHELVRHRICSLSMESTRYVKYNEVEFIRPI
jgi:thymidylate synthase (FAD)